MLDGASAIEYRMVACGHQHEEGFDTCSIAKTIEKVRECQMRQGNLLCAHTDQFPQERQDIFETILRKAEKLSDTNISEIIKQIKGVNRILDNLVRSSYVMSLWSGGGTDIPDTELWNETRGYLSEILDILDRTAGKSKTLNKGERTRFDFLVKKIQFRSKEILEGVLPQVV